MHFFSTSKLNILLFPITELTDYNDNECVFLICLINHILLSLIPLCDSTMRGDMREKTSMFTVEEIYECIARKNARMFLG